MKRVIAVIITLLLILNIPIMGISQNETTLGIKDINDHWANGAITKWIDSNLVIGYPDNTFKPNGKTTKAEFLTLIKRVYGFYETAENNYSDVLEKDWYYNATLIAKKNKYMDWYTESELKANEKITRQEVCAIISSIYDLQASEGLTGLNDFNDKDEIPDWSKGYIDALASKGYIIGYEDKTIRAQDEITRAEAVTIIDRVMGELINKEGTYGPEESMNNIENNLTINTKGVILRNTVIKGDLILAAGIKEGDVDLQNVTVIGKTIINGGGENSIIFDSCELEEIIVYKVNGEIRVVSKSSNIGKMILKSSGKLEGNFENAKVEILGEGEEIILEGNFDELKIDSQVQIKVTGDTEINKLEITEKAKGTNVKLERKAEVKEIIFNEGATVTGQGKIILARVNTNGVSVEQRVTRKIVLRGVDDSGVKVIRSGSSGGSSRDTIAPIVGNSGTITTSNVDTTSLTLNWTKATDNRSAQSNLEYLAYYSSSNNIDTVADIESNGTAVGSYTTDIEEVNVTGLTESTTYYFNVIVKDEAGNKSVYKAISETTLTTSDTTVPIVGNSGTITTSNVDTTSLTLNWTKASDNRSAQSDLEYLAYYSSSNNIDTVADIESNGTAVGSYIADIEEVNVTGLTESTTYYFNVIVKDEAGNKSVYKAISETTLTTSDTTVPIVGNSGTITTSNVDTTSLTLNWTKASDNRSAQSDLEYLAYYSTTNNIDTVADIEANGTEIGSYTADIESVNVTGLTESTTYYFNIIVKDEAGNKSVYTTKEETTLLSIGSGTSDDPFKIRTIEDLASIGRTDLRAEWGLDKHYILMNDLDFDNDSSYNDPNDQSFGDINEDGSIDGIKSECITEGKKGWKSIGNTTNKFTGTFDGDNNTISNLYINRPSEDNIALFGFISNPGEIKKLTLQDVDIDGNNIVGTIVAQTSYVDITNCESTGTINALNNVGGIVGSVNRGSIQDSDSSVTITAVDNVGGIAGNSSDSAIIDCFSIGQINANRQVGGIVGYSYYTTIENCYSTGEINASNDYVGGIVGGRTDERKLSNCYSTGNIKGNSKVGGIVGGGDGSIQNCYTIGNVEGNLDYVGGILGDGRGNIYNCYSKGNIKGKSYIGGIVGYKGHYTGSGGTINNCYSTGTIEGATSYAGGIIGYMKRATVKNSYSIGSIVGTASYVGGISGYSYGSTGNKIENVCAFNPSINAQGNVNRILAHNQHAITLSNNHAYTNMSINNGAVTGTSNANTLWGADIIAINQVGDEPLHSWDFDETDADNDDAYWKIEPGADRPVLYVDPDDDGIFVKLGNDDGKIVIPPDTTVPSVGNSGTITTSSVDKTSLTLNWTKASDNRSAQSDLEYLCYYSSSNNINTVADIEANGTEIGSYTADIDSVNVTGLTENTTYYFNVIVKDEAGNKSVYTAKEETTTSSITYLINDDFEAHPVGVAPIDWISVHNPSRIVVDDVKKNGNNSLMLTGAPGNAVALFKNIDTTGLSSLTFETYLYPTSMSENGTMELSTDYTQLKLRVTVLNGFIQYSTTAHDNEGLVPIVPYEINTWYHVKIVADLVNENYDIYIDGVELVSDIPMINMHTPITAAGISSGNLDGSNIIYFDDIKVYGE